MHQLLTRDRWLHVLRKRLQRAERRAAEAVLADGSRIHHQPHAAVQLRAAVHLHLRRPLPRALRLCLQGQEGVG
ncbi:unnamed protein product [Leptidea sinapis]|uniref:Uncharacterized protein n=1 Tax=Leptidea sinapis TaxID=189913 RepID=A0A5E4PRR8_9NEOP|nr:unnamed protein product [Leptidea sinapis]